MENKAKAGAEPAGKKQGGIKEFFSLGEVGNYFFRKKDPSRPSNINIRMMHGVNKLSIAIFLVGVLYLVYKLVIKPRL
ncbi:DUF6728 family protein [Dawidia soli]|uniref:Uncharacterized protein n=1 Tax=Dawidia soli TaxID=2782352 RepID=A0AAP2D5P7_9BACT|nr:DUF6728 family protein [Dawidia soli]MBT1685858.1 hypothetical protein [Dawidia soli]